MVGHMKLAASLIIRNELGRYLQPCVASLLEFCDEVRVLDDGSTDGWVEAMTGVWGADGGRVVTTRHKVEDRDRHDDFHLHAAARNRLLEFTLDGHPDWVLELDADEFVSDGAAIRAAAESASTDVLSLEIAEIWNASETALSVREDGGWRPHEIGCLWRADSFRRQPLKITDRGHATGRVPDQVHLVKSRPTGASLFHFGWTNRAERAERFKRYDVGDAGKFHAASHIASIMWPDEKVRLADRPWPDGLSGEVRAKILSRCVKEEMP